MLLFFPITFDDLLADVHYIEKLKGGPLEIDGTQIDSIPLQHPQGGFGYRFHEGEKSLVFITDNELREDAWEGRSPGEYIKFCREADVLIHDCQYSPEEIVSRKNWGHSDYQSVMDMALEAGVKRLILFHHDPSREDSEVKVFEDQCQKIAQERKSDMVIEAAKEDSEIEL